MSSGRGASRKGPLFWILTGGVVFLVLLFGGLFLIGWRSRAYGEPMNALRTFVRMDSNNEILEEDPGANTIRFRNKRTGRESIYTIDPATKQFHVIEGKETAPSPTPAQ